MESSSVISLAHNSSRAGRSLAVFQKIHGLLAKDGWFLFTHAGADGEFEYQMMGKPLTYADLAPDVLRSSLLEMGFQIELFAQDYREEDASKGLVAILRK